MQSTTRGAVLDNNRKELTVRINRDGAWLPLPQNSIFQKSPIDNPGPRRTSVRRPRKENKISGHNPANITSAGAPTPQAGPSPPQLQRPWRLIVQRPELPTVSRPGRPISQQIPSGRGRKGLKHPRMELQISLSL